MERLVIKFGGTSLADTARLKRAANIVSGHASQHVQTAVVVSAMGDTTDILLSMADGLSVRTNLREIDLLLSTGEQISATLMAIALNALGLPARSFTGGQAGIITDCNHGDARIIEVKKTAMEECLASGIIPVVTGFQGVDLNGELTTLGRGGSDITAIALAAHLKASRCDIYSDVAGVFTADPHVLEESFKLPVLTYDDMLELAAHGAQVLNRRAVEIAAKENVPVRVRSTFAPDDPGTLIKAVVEVKQPIVSIACSEDRLYVRLAPDTGCGSVPNGNWKEVALALLNQGGVAAEVGFNPESNGDGLYLSVCHKDDLKLSSIINQANGHLGPLAIEKDYHLAAISAVGEVLHCELDAVNVLKKHAIPIKFIGGTKRRLSLLVPVAFRPQALQLLHDCLCGTKKAA